LQIALEWHDCVSTLAKPFEKKGVPKIMPFPYFFTVFRFVRT